MPDDKRFQRMNREVLDPIAESSLDPDRGQTA